MSLPDPYITFNYLEGLAWLALAMTLPFFVRPATTRQKLIVFAACLGFAFFGWSDFMEAPLQGRLPIWLWSWKIMNATFLLACRFTYLGWHRFRFSDPYVRFALILFAAALTAIVLQGTLYGF